MSMAIRPTNSTDQVYAGFPFSFPTFANIKRVSIELLKSSDIDRHQKIKSLLGAVHFLDNAPVMQHDLTLRVHDNVYATTMARMLDQKKISDAVLTLFWPKFHAS